MARTSEVVAGVTIGIFIGLAAGLALTPGPADAGYGVAPALVASNLPAKADMFATAEPVPVSRNALPAAVEVAQVQKIGNDVVLLDAKGRIVYRSQGTNTTAVEKTHAPLVTGYGVGVTRVEAAFNATQQ